MAKLICKTNGIAGYETKAKAKIKTVTLDSNVGIYACICESAQSVYIGQSKCMSNRWRNHLMNLRKNNYKNTSSQWQTDFNKLGETEFKFKVLENCDIIDLLNLETSYIKQYVRDGWFLYNDRLVTNEHNWLSCKDEYVSTLKKLIRALDKGQMSIEHIEQAIISFE